MSVFENELGDSSMHCVLYQGSSSHLSGHDSELIRRKNSHVVLDYRVNSLVIE
ncbi:hypothetical protein OIU74_007011 [Salix koriyanagi]|uniref:Uncharacterized protein n=1 Tax=Salix koriyanagi TaxID=2511006 RepID=A0A9Q0U2N4_9ROSI|nr:hypothetical protein OIU74_007011 [Salix koriyanagi]